jgi:hypothetical protein
MTPNGSMPLRAAASVRVSAKTTRPIEARPATSADAFLTQPGRFSDLMAQAIGERALDACLDA